MKQANDTFHPSRSESNFIAAIRFLMIVGLTYHHLFSIPGSAYYPRHSFQQYTHLMPDLINGFFHLAFMAAVPVLSIVSGFLFFRRSHLDFRQLLQKRFFTVAVPSWLWSAVWLSLAFFLYQIGHQRGWFQWANYGFDDFTLLTLANGLVGVTEHPFAFQFWFVHDLILTLLLAPLVYRLVQRLGVFFLIPMVLLWVSGFVPPPFFSFNVLFFFCLGAYLGLPGGAGLSAALQTLDRFGWYVVPVFALAVLARLFSHALFDLAFVIDSHGYLCLLRIMGVLAFSQIIYAVVRRGGWMNERLIRYSGYSFFVFAVHFPLIEIFKVGAMRIPGADTGVGYFLLWLLVPLMTVAACIAGAKLLERSWPAAFRLLNGGRGAARPSPQPTRRHETQGEQRGGAENDGRSGGRVPPIGRGQPARH